MPTKIFLESIQIPFSVVNNPLWEELNINYVGHTFDEQNGLCVNFYNHRSVSILWSVTSKEKPFVFATLEFAEIPDKVQFIQPRRRP